GRNVLQTRVRVSSPAFTGVPSNMCRLRGYASGAGTSPPGSSSGRWTGPDGITTSRPLLGQATPEAAASTESRQPDGTACTVAGSGTQLVSAPPPPWAAQAGSCTEGVPPAGTEAITPAAPESETASTPAATK